MFRVKYLSFEIKISNTEKNETYYLADITSDKEKDLLFL